MSQQGWYPDPGGQPGRFRWWDGERWSETTSASSGAQPPADAAAGPGSGRGTSRRTPIWALVTALVLVAAVAIGYLVVRHRSDGGSQDSSQPSISAWDEKSSPSPSSASPSPSGSGGLPARCEQRAPNQLGQPQVQGGRLRVGELSMAVPAGWSGPRHEGRMPFGRDDWGYGLIDTKETRQAWESSMMIGATTFAADVPLRQQATTLLQCISTSSFYAPLTVQVADLKVTDATVGGRQAVRLSCRLTFDDPRLSTKGSVLSIVIVQGRGGSQFFFGATAREDAGQVNLLNQTALGLAG